MTETVYNPELRDCRLLTVHFEFNRSFVPGQESRLETKMTMNHNYFQDEKGQNCLRLLLKVWVSGEGAPASAEVEVGSLFVLASQPVTPLAESRLAEIDCAAVIFPYLRETLADLTRRAGLPPLHLPPINFVEFYKQNHPGM